MVTTWKTCQKCSFYGWTCCDQGPDIIFRFTVGPAAIRDQTTIFVLRLDLLRSETRHYFSFYAWTCCDQGPDKNFRFTLGPAAIRDQTKIYRFTVGPAAIRDQIKKKKKFFIFLGWTCCCDQRDLRANRRVLILLL